MHSLSCGLPRQAQRVWSQELRLFIPARHNIETSNGKSNCLIIFQLNSDSTPSTHLVISSSRTLSHRDRSDVQRCPLLSRPNGCRAAEHVPPICAGKGQLLGNATEASTRTIRKIAWCAASQTKATPCASHWQIRMTAWIQLVWRFKDVEHVWSIPVKNDWMKENIHNFNHFCHHYHLFHVYTFSILPGYQSLSPTAVQMNCPRLPSETLVTQDWKRLEDPPGSSRLLSSWLILIAFNARVAKDITRRGNRKQVTRPCRIKSSIQILGHRDVRVDGKNEVLDPCGPKVGEVTGYSFPITSARKSLNYSQILTSQESNSIKFNQIWILRFYKVHQDETRYGSLVSLYGGSLATTKYYDS